MPIYTRLPWSARMQSLGEQADLRAMESSLADSPFLSARLGEVDRQRVLGTAVPMPANTPSSINLL